MPTAPTSWSLLTGFIVLAVVVAGIFISTVEYARKETAAGSLIAAGGVVRITARREGVVTDLKVSDGDRVEAGQALFTVGSRQGLEGGGTLDGALLASLETQARLLEEQIDADPARVRMEAVRLDAAIETVRIQQGAILGQRELQLERVRFNEERRDTLAQLYQRGNVTKVALLEQEEALLSSRQNLADLDRQIAALRKELEQTQLQREQLPVQQSERLAQLRLSLADRERQKAEVEAQRAQVIRAPVAGRVTALQVGAGQIVDPSRPLLTLVPEGTELRAELFVPSRAIGFIAPGQRVRLMIDAFPYQRFGTQVGRVETVSQAILSPNEVFGKVTLNEPAYRVLVSLDRQFIDAFGRHVPLQQDMTLTADVVLEGRTLLEWVLEPLLSARGRM